MLFLQINTLSQTYNIFKKLTYDLFIKDSVILHTILSISINCKSIVTIVNS